MHPPVTVIVPVLDERTHIESTMGDLLAQSYEGTLEVVVADGGSTDGTREWLEALSTRDPRVRVVDNPRRRQAYGLNDAAAAATGEILVRADGHSRYAPDYVARSVETLQHVGGAVGGRMNPVGYDSFSDAVAAAMNSPLTMGPGRFHHASALERVDTVYLGAFFKEDFTRIGGMRSLPSGSSEDADFYFRFRAADGHVHVDPAIVSAYAPRNSWSALWRQYWRYGQGKAEMLWLNGRFPSWRPMAPLLLVASLIASIVTGLVFGVWGPVAGILAVWLAALAVVAFRSHANSALVLLAAATMHVAYGLGGLWGLLRGPIPLRHLR
jgi:succinoglycan biosynthesis protein ExoA